MVKKSSPKSDASFNEKMLQNIKSNTTSIKKTNKDYKKLQKELVTLKKKVSTLENTVTKNNKNNQLVEKWKHQFETIEKTFLESGNNLKEKIPILLMDVMKNINELHKFNLTLINGVTSRKRKYSSETEYSVEDEYDDDLDEELDEEDYELINEANKDKEGRNSKKSENKIIDKRLINKETYKLNSKVEKLFKLHNLYKDYNLLDDENKGAISEYIQLFIKNDKIKQLTKQDIVYFMSIDIEEKLKLINKEIDINNLTDTTIPPRYKIMNSSLPIEIKNKCLLKLATFNYLDHNSSEFHKMKTWMNGLIDMPWNTYKSLPVNIANNTPHEIYSFLEKGIQSLNDCVYGQTRTKQHMMQLVSKIISNPKSIGNVFSIYGPMGTGKTTIIKEGLSKLLGLPFNFISLGGASDSSFLDGHSYTYEGSIPGRIVEALKSTKCMNPIFYFDELDKVSDTSRGLEIINLLIHLTDPAQNSHFQDKYYGDIPFDLSKALFVFSFNNINRVNPILRDRMNLIKVDGFTEDEKFIITRDFLLPSIMKEYLIKPGDIVLGESVIKYIITKNIDASQTKEEGVRGIKKRIEIIISNLNVIKIAFIDVYKNKIKLNSSSNNKNKSKRRKKNKEKEKEKERDKDRDIEKEVEKDKEIVKEVEKEKGVEKKLDIENIKKILPDLKLGSIDSKTIQNLKLPIQVTNELVDLFLSSEININTPPFGMYT